MGPVSEELSVFLDKIKNSNLDKEQSVILLGELISSIIENNLSMDSRWNVSMTINGFSKRI